MACVWRSDSGTHFCGPAGTISSYDPGSGVLTIDLAKGGATSALVTDDTSIETGGDWHGDDSRRGRRTSDPSR